MPISLWIKWRAWAKFNGPLGALGDDYRAAFIAFQTARPGLTEQDTVLKFLPPWRRASDYRPWVDFGDLAEIEKPPEFEIE